ncbi:hypothetical protein PV735_46665 [Streptomyces turgidiscabies]|uniref:Uncharacterized protein n=1 Tax=Streptomyces turgidiscabies (strain Car8) TaxID=698760 RepID=L7FFQ8_STRT8|nr:hypothetical protein [Streptomyces turgidiscabies]ELP69515.1 hypothetical protein STRTUCAR8_00026 [Streptomyces turgidiscabies Car8]MDX3500104.1 hypothetical protein [Streptomyces turgidiscabies]GAQ77186.1 hypothetical protein T45_09002 [Streptomyces turgidiscabies]
MTDLVTAYGTAPGLYDEEQELVRTMSRLPLRERLLRRAALADRGTLDASEADGKAQQSIRSAALKLAAHDQAHGTSAGPIAPTTIDTDSPAAALRSYVRQEYAAWSAPAGPSVWLVTRAEDPGAIPCEDEATARAYAETRYRQDEDPAAPAVLRWDEDGELVDETLPSSYQGTGWTAREEQVIRAADLPNVE